MKLFENFLKIVLLDGWILKYSCLRWIYNQQEGNGVLLLLLRQQCFLQMVICECIQWIENGERERSKEDNIYKSVYCLIRNGNYSLVLSSHTTRRTSEDQSWINVKVLTSLQVLRYKSGDRTGKCWEGERVTGNKNGWRTMIASRFGSFLFETRSNQHLFPSHIPRIHSMIPIRMRVVTIKGFTVVKDQFKISRWTIAPPALIVEENLFYDIFSRTKFQNTIQVTMARWIGPNRHQMKVTRIEINQHCT